MPLHARTAPALALRTVQAALSSPPATEQRPEPPITPPGVEATGLTTPLPVYALSSVSEEDPRTHLVGWRFLLRAGERTVGAANFLPTASGWDFSHVSEGPYVTSAERCLSEAETLTAPYEPRLLCVPELYMVTLWLRCLGPTMEQSSLGGADLLVPLAPAPPGIAAESPRRVDGLLPLLTHRLSPAPTPLLRTA